jgi:hypothetical protein
LAQRAFRQRQINTIRRLEDQAAAFRDIIREISDAAAGVNDPLLNAAIDRSWAALGLSRNPSMPVPLPTEPPITDSAGGEPPVGEQQQQQQQANALQGDVGQWWSQQGQVGWPRAPGTGQPTQQPDTDELALARLTPEPWPEYENVGSTVARPQTGRSSPRLTYGLWWEPERPVWTNDPPPDIMPFLTSSYAQPFACTLFWRTLVTGHAVISAWHRIPPDQRPQRLTDLVQQIFEPTLLFHPADGIVAGFHARLSYKKHGYIETGHPGGRFEVNPHQGEPVTEYIIRQGRDIRIFLNQWATQDFVRQMIGDALFKQVEQGILSGDEQSKEYQFGVKFGQRLSLRATCFGDGARYPIHAIREVLGGLMTEIPLQLSVELPGP